MKSPGLAIAIMGSKKKPAEGKEPEEDEGEEMDAAEVAAEAFIDAVNSGDAKALVEAFKDLKDSCSSYEE